MEKTLWYGFKPEGAGSLTPCTYRKVTARKIDEIEAGISNLYEDAEGNRYYVQYSKIKRRHEFFKIR